MEPMDGMNADETLHCPPRFTSLAIRVHPFHPLYLRFKLDPVRMPGTRNEILFAPHQGQQGAPFN